MHKIKGESKAVFQTESMAVVEDEENQDVLVIDNVKLVGRESKNGYSYSDEALEKAVEEGLYNNRPLWDLHPTKDERKKGETRNNRQYIGKTLGNATYKEGAIFGSIAVCLENESAKTFAWRAKNDHLNIGISHEAWHSPIDESTGIISDIYEIEGFASTSKPATTKNLYESRSNVDLKTMTIAMLIAQSPAVAELQKSYESLQIELKEFKEQQKSFESMQCELDKAKAENALLSVAIDKGMSPKERDFLAAQKLTGKAEIEKSLESMREIYADQIKDGAKRSEESMAKKAPSRIAEESEKTKASDFCFESWATQNA